MKRAQCPSNITTTEHEFKHIYNNKHKINSFIILIKLIGASESYQYRVIEYESCMLTVSSYEHDKRIKFYAYQLKQYYFAQYNYSTRKYIGHA